MKESKQVLVRLTKKDFRIEWFSGSGKGGQYRNKHPNCCRIHHDASGTMAICQEHRDRPSNQRDAFKRLTDDPKFKAWLKLESLRVMGKDQEIKEKVESEIKNNTITEVKDENGNWVKE